MQLPVSNTHGPHRHHEIAPTHIHDMSETTFSEKIHSADLNHVPTLDKKTAAVIKIPKGRNLESVKSEIRHEIKNIFLFLIQLNYEISSAIKIFQEFHPIKTKEVKEYHDVTKLISKGSRVIEEIEKLPTLIEQLRIDAQNSDETNSPIAEVVHNVHHGNLVNENFIFKTIYLIPDLADNIYSYVRHFGKIKEVAGVTTGLLLAGNIVEVVSAAHDLYKTNETRLTHQRHVADLSSPVVDIANATTENRNIDEIETFENKTQKTIFTLLHKRKQVFEKRLERENQWFDVFLQKHRGDFAAFRVDLKENGLHLPDEIASFEQITPELKSALLKQKVEIKDSLTNMAKNQLKARLQAQEEVNHKFFNFKLNASIIKYGVTVISCITTVTLTLLMPFIAFPPLLLMIPVVLGIATSYGLISLGAYHLHQTKPNLAKVYLSLDRLNLFLNKIPLLYAEYNFKSYEFKQIDAQDSLQNETLDYWKKETAHYQNKIKTIEDKILQAKKDDFEVTGFKSFTNDEFAEIANALVSGEFWNDPETAAFIKKYTGIEMSESENSAKETEILSKKLRDTILRNSKSTLKWLESMSIKETKV